ncbi:hypothetical protein DIPPA_54310 [Diplonema papillatum]|nr:hypothetical protein DIPPA_54310 [Diplonema papillatum]
MSALLKGLRDEEWKELWRIGWPIALSDMFLASSAVITGATIGHICGTDAMAAVVVAQAFMILTKIFAQSTTDTLNTLCSQARGANNAGLVGIWLQTGLIVYSTLMLPVFVVWWFGSRPFLRIMNVKDEVVNDGVDFTKASIPGAYLIGLKYCFEQYFAALGVVRPAMVIGAIFVVVNAGLCILFMKGIPGTAWEGMGLVGSPVGNAVTQLLQVVTYLWWCSRKGYAGQYWQGWDVKGATKSSRALEYLKLCVPTAIGAVVEQGQWQLLTVFTVHLGSIDVASWLCVASLWDTLVATSLGFSKSVNLRTAFHLGADNVRAAKTVVRYGVTCITVLSALAGIIIFSLQDYVGYIYTTDPDVLDTVRSLCWLVSVGLIPLNVGLVGLFVLDAQGRPGLGAAIIGIGTWGIDVPLAAVFIYVLGWGVKGLLGAVLIGYGVSVLVAWIFVIRSDWEKCVLQAQMRSEKKGTAESSILVTGHSAGPTQGLVEALINDRVDTDTDCDSEHQVLIHHHAPPDTLGSVQAECSFPPMQ